MTYINKPNNEDDPFKRIERLMGTNISPQLLLQNARNGYILGLKNALKAVKEQSNIEDAISCIEELIQNKLEEYDKNKL